MPLLHSGLILLIVLGLLLGADRWLHRHLQGVTILLTGNQDIALWLYAILLFPGVTLHELSHALSAALLGVKIGGISLLPQQKQGHIQLGFVPVEETDFLRASCIGAAPLLIGSAVIIAIGYSVFGTPAVLSSLATGNWWGALQGLRHALHAPDAWVWAYLIFAIGNTMLPSRSDTHAWPLLGAVLVFGGTIIVLAGAGALLLKTLSQLLTGAVHWVILLGVSTLLIDLPFFLLIIVAEKILEWLKRQKIVYR